MVPKEATEELNKLHEMRLVGDIPQSEYEKRKRELFKHYNIQSPRDRKRPGGMLVFFVVGLSFAVGWVYSMTPFGQQYGGLGAGIIGTMVGLFLYLLPAFVAYQRSHHNRHAILVLNLFAGWLLVGWIAALIWSATATRSNGTGV